MASLSELSLLSLTLYSHLTLKLNDYIFPLKIKREFEFRSSKIR